MERILGGNGYLKGLQADGYIVQSPGR